MLFLWSNITFQPLKEKMNFILIWYLSMFLKPFTAWLNTTARWTKGCLWYILSFTVTRYAFQVKTKSWNPASKFYWIKFDWLSAIFKHFFLISFFRMPFVSSCWHCIMCIVIWQIFRALSYIHNCIGVCHRDIKPQNLLVSLLITFTFTCQV